MHSQKSTSNESYSSVKVKTPLLSESRVKKKKKKKRDTKEGRKKGERESRDCAFK